MAPRGAGAAGDALQPGRQAGERQPLHVQPVLARERRAHLHGLALGERRRHLQRPRRRLHGQRLPSAAGTRPPCTPLHPPAPPCTPLQAELPELVRIVCALLDIPVYSSLTESLHVLFSLYSDFKANVHFQQQIGEEGGMSGMDGMGGMSGMGGSDGMGMLNDAMGHSDQLIMPS